MDASIRDWLEQTKSADDAIRLNAFNHLLDKTEMPVDWVYEAWDDLVSRVNDPNSYQRTIAVLLLCNLAQSDSKGRMASILPSILEHTKDEKFITSRQCIQVCWKIAIYQPILKDQVVSHLAARFRECANENHANLLRLDLIHALKKINNDRELDGLLDELISLETNEKYRLSYRK